MTNTLLKRWKFDSLTVLGIFWEFCYLYCYSKNHITCLTWYFLTLFNSSLYCEQFHLTTQKHNNKMSMNILAITFVFFIFFVGKLMLIILFETSTTDNGCRIQIIEIRSVMNLVFKINLEKNFTKYFLNENVLLMFMLLCWCLLVRLKWI